jgi:hypothetical protein
LDLRSEILLYACKIKETTNGRGRSSGRETWGTFQVVAQRRVARNVQIDEQKRAAQNGQDETERKADSETQEALKSPFYEALSVEIELDCFKLYLV